MDFEWDESKNNSNKSKHDIYFETAKNIFQDENCVEIITPYPIKNRFITIGKLDRKLLTAIFTIRGNALRIISVRRSREKEVKLYEEKYFG
jgi:hypothetical protein